MADFLMKPKIDFAFKEIMTDEKARTGFLSAILKLNPEDIRETTLLNTNLRKIYEDDKLGIFDVGILMNDDSEIDIDNILLWAKFINAEQKEEFDMVATKDPYIESAYRKLQIISQDKEKRLEYEAREKAIRDYNQFMYEAEQRGWKIGKTEGRLEASLAIAKNLLDSGIPKETVIQNTGLSSAQIEQL